MDHSEYELEEMHTILNHLNDAIFELDEHYVFLQVMTPDQELLFVPKKEIIGKNIRDIFWPEIAEMFEAELMFTKENQNRTIYYKLPQKGREHYYKADLKHIQISNKSRYLAILTDITEQEHLEQTAHRYKQELEKQVAFQKLLFDISSEFLNVKIDLMDASFLKSLEKICSFIKADRCFLMKYNENYQSVSCLYKWCIPSVLECNMEKDDDFAVSILKWLKNNKKGKVNCIQDSDVKISEEEKKYLKNNGIETLIMVPIMSKKECFGFLSFEYCVHRTECQNIIQSLLSSYGQLLLTLLKRKANEEEIIRKTYEMESFFLVSLDFLCILDRFGRFSKLNKTWEQSLDYRDEELVGKKMTDFVHEQDIWQTEQIFKELENGKTVLNFVNRICNKRNEYRVIEWSIRPHGLDYFAAARDISGRKLLEDTLHLQKELYQTTLLSIGDGVISFDENDEIKIMNQAAAQLCGLEQREAAGEKLNRIFAVLKDPLSGRDVNPVEEVRIYGKRLQYDQLLATNMQNQEIIIETTVSPVYGIDTKIQGSVMIFKNVTETKKKQIDSLYLSLHDYLTGLYNRRFFEEEMIRLDTKRNLPLSIIMIDGNGLKLTNDAFGHEEGDLLLKKVAQIIKSECRHDEIAARLGGDEFAILLPKTDTQNCEMISQRIQKACKRSTRQTVVVSVAAGFSVKKRSDESMEDILKTADNNMYRNKLITGREMRTRTFMRILRNLEQEYQAGKKSRSIISQVACSIGKAIPLLEEEIRELEDICLLHDIGEIVVPKIIFKKKGSLTEDEYSIVKRHPEAGYQILKSMEEYSAMANYVLSHHEKWDGSGYPRKLKGEAIPLYSRIIAIADAYEAMTSGRSYKKAMSREEAMLEILKNAGTAFDPSLVRVFSESNEIR